MLWHHWHLLQGSPPPPPSIPVYILLTFSANKCLPMTETWMALESLTMLGG